MSIRWYWLSLGLLVCFGSGCIFRSPRIEVTRVVPEATITAANPLLTDATELRQEILWTKTPVLQVGENTLSFKVRTAEGMPLSSDDLLLIREKKVHALLVREDFTGFQHLYPEAAKNDWVLPVSLSQPGTYHFYLEYQPVRERRVLVHTSFLIPGLAPLRAKVPIVTSQATVGGVTALLDLPASIEASSTVKLQFRLLRGGELVQELGPYLGAFGHVAVLQRDRPSRYLSVHPIDDRQPKDGTVSFETVFPEPGLYPLYAEFNIAGSLKTFPFFVMVNQRTTSTLSGAGMTDRRLRAP